MMNLIVVGVLILLLFVLFKVKRMKHKAYASLIILLVLFLYTTGSRIVTEGDIDIKTFDGMVTATRLYFKWLGNAINNARTIIGNTLKMEW